MKLLCWEHIYDHIGLQTESAKIINKDSIANGANDNAAGSVAILEMAKYFSSEIPREV